MSTSTLAFDIIARDKASSKFDALGNSAEKSSGKLKKFAMVGAAAVAGGAVLAGKALFDLTKMAVEDEKSQKTLATALKNSAGATKGQVKATEDWISKQGEALGIADDELRPALARLANATGDVGKAQKLTALAMDVSAGTGKSLTTVTDALMKAQNGSTAGLSKMGVAVKNADGSTKSLTQITRELAQLHGGQAATAANTAEGKFKRLNLMFEEGKEAIGQKLLPVALKLGNWLLNEGAPAMRKFGDWIGKNVVPPLKDMANAVGPVLVPVLKTLGRIVGEVLPPLLKGLAKALEGVAEAGKWMWNNVLKPVFSNFLDAIVFLSKKVAGFLDALSKAPGMGWAAGAAEKLRKVADQAGRARDNINGIDTSKTVSIGIQFLYPQGKPPKVLEPDNFTEFYNGRMAKVAPSLGEQTMALLAKGFKSGGKKSKAAFAEAMDAIRDKFAGYRDELRSIASGVASALNPSSFGFSDIAPEFDSETGAMTTPGQSALQQMMASLGAQTAQLAGVTAVFEKLKTLVSPTFLRQLMESGNTQLILQLANDPAAAQAASAAFQHNQEMAAALGNKVAEQQMTIMAPAIAAAVGAEVAKMERALENQPGKIGNAIEKALKDLKIVIKRGGDAGRDVWLQGAWV